jgi:hypothetical protein
MNRHWISAFLLIGSLAAGVRAEPRCGTRDPTTAEVEAARKVINLRRGAQPLTPFREIKGWIVVPLRFVSVQRRDGDTLIGQVSDETLARQVEFLNTRFESAEIQFIQLGPVDVVESLYFFNVLQGEASARGLAVVHGKNHARQANVFLCKPLSWDSMKCDDESLLGFATEITKMACLDCHEFDGIFVDYETLPGGSLENYNQGVTLVHEMGHWLGLNHTFGKTCEDDDGVSDTPRHLEPKSFDIDTISDRDTCPSDPGQDPLNNFMSYARDKYLTEMTAGQITRLRSETAAIRFELCDQSRRIFESIKADSPHLLDNQGRIIVNDESRKLIAEFVAEK